MKSIDSGKLDVPQAVMNEVKSDAIRQSKRVKSDESLNTIRLIKIVPTEIAVTISMQQFLELPKYLAAIKILDTSSNPDEIFRDLLPIEINKVLLQVFQYFHKVKRDGKKPNEVRNNFGKKNIEKPSRNSVSYIHYTVMTFRLARNFLNCDIEMIRTNRDN